MHWHGPLNRIEALFEQFIDKSTLKDCLAGRKRLTAYREDEKQAIREIRSMPTRERKL